MEEKENMTINNKTNIWAKLAFILRYIFFGFLVWSYYFTIYAISKTGVIGAVGGFIAILMFYTFKDGINPIKKNNKEFGKYTDIIGILISIIFMFCCLVPLFGMGFYK